MLPSTAVLFRVDPTLERNARQSAVPALLILVALLASLLAGRTAEAGVFVNSIRWPADPATGFTIVPVCIVDGSSSTQLNDAFITGHDPNPSLASVIGQVRAALSRSWETRSNVRFTGFENCSALSNARRIESVGLNINPSAPNNSSVGTNAQLRFQGDGISTQFKPWGNNTQCIDFDFSRFINEYRFECVEEYAIHEFGHVLSFIHEWRHPRVAILDPDCFASQVGGTEPPVLENRTGTTFSTANDYTVTRLNQFDRESIMTYTNECANVTGERFGSRNLSAIDIENVAEVYPPVPLGQFDVGVIPNVAGSCPETDEVAIFLDNENSNNANSTAGWRGAIVSNTNTRLEFCRVDGSRFKNLSTGLALPAGGRQADYAVLKLGETCPPGSVEILRAHDDENGPPVNENYLYGAASSSAPGFATLQLGSTTYLHWCVFRPEQGSGPYMRDFPANLGFDYGVLAAADFVAAAETGSIRLDDEDSSNGNLLTLQGFQPLPGNVVLSVSRLIESGADTRYHLAQVGAQSDVADADDSFEDNDSLTQDNGLLIDNDFSATNLRILSNDDDYWRLKPLRDRRLTIDVDFVDAAGDIDVQLLDASGSVLTQSASSTDDERIVFDVSRDTMYFARVFGFDGAANSYNLRFRFDDALEPNDSRPDATVVISTAEIENLRVSIPGDEDFFRYTNTSSAPRSLTADIAFAHANGDLDMEILNESGGRLVVSNSASNDETATIDNIAPGDSVFVRVFGFSGAGNDYDLRLSSDDALEDNDTAATATPLSGDVRLIALRQSRLDPDFFSWAPPFSGRIEVNLEFSHAEADLRLELYLDTAPGPVLVRTVDTATDNEQLVADVGGFSYFIAVQPNSDASTDYDLTLTFDDCFEDNDAPGSPTILPAGNVSEANLKIVSGDDDFFTWQPNAAAGDVLIEIDFEHASGNLDLEVHDAGGTPVATSTSSDDDEHVLLERLTGQPMLAIRVFGLSSAANPLYALSITEFPDSDGDGLTDVAEQALGTNPANPDSDGDGVSDFDEVNRDGNPQDYQPGIDTDPTNPDTDGDGLEDGVDPEPLVPAVRTIPLPAGVLALLAIGLLAGAIRWRARRRSS